MKVKWLHSLLTELGNKMGPRLRESRDHLIAQLCTFLGLPYTRNPSARGVIKPHESHFLTDSSLWWNDMKQYLKERKGVSDWKDSMEDGTFRKVNTG